MQYFYNMLSISMASGIDEHSLQIFNITFEIDQFNTQNK